MKNVMWGNFTKKKVKGETNEHYGEKIWKLEQYKGRNNLPKRFKGEYTYTLRWLVLGVTFQRIICNMDYYIVMVP